MKNKFDTAGIISHVIGRIGSHRFPNCGVTDSQISNRGPAAKESGKSLQANGNNV
jgi:hypothetical protein